MRGRFEIIKTLGEGTYGKVRLVVDKSTNTKIAVKYIKKAKIREDDDLERIGREIQIVSTIKHPHIVHVREVFDVKDTILLLMDWAPGGELFDYIDQNGALPEHEAKRVFKQIVSAVGYIHKRGMVHRDLKLENIVIDEHLNIKITDFGLSNYYSNKRFLTTYCGSPLYASPEILNGIPYHGPEVDCWSLGVILYTLVYGCMPFDGNSLFSLRKRISSAKYKEPTPRSGATGLIKSLLSVNPLRRPNAKDIMQHCWMKRDTGKTQSCLSLKDIGHSSLGHGASCSQIAQESQDGLLCGSGSNKNASTSSVQSQDAVITLKDISNCGAITEVTDITPRISKRTVWRVLRSKVKFLRKRCQAKLTLGEINQPQQKKCYDVSFSEECKNKQNSVRRSSSWDFTPVKRSQKILNKDRFSLKEEQEQSEIFSPDPCEFSVVNCVTPNTNSLLEATDEKECISETS